MAQDEEENAPQVREKSLLGHFLCSDVLPEKFLQRIFFRFLEIDDVTKIGTLYKISSSKISFIFESIKMMEKLQ